MRSRRRAPRCCAESSWQRHGPSFADLVLGDGLYLTAPMLRLVRQELGAHLLVKTTELETLNILKDAEAIFQSPECSRDGAVEHAQATDAERAMAYEVWAAPGFHHVGYDKPLKVARVELPPPQGTAQRATVVEGRTCGSGSSRPMKR
jgi:hypothetical protein